MSKLNPKKRAQTSVPSDKDANYVREGVRKVLISQFGVTEEATEDFSKDLIMGFGADSLDVVEFIMQIEEHFDIFISEEDSEKIGTVSDVYNLVCSKLGISE